MKRKRDRLEIIHDILLTLREKGETKPTHILYRSNLSHQMLTEYLNELVEKGLVLQQDNKNHKTYALTEKAYQFLNEFESMRAFIESYGL